MTPFQIAQSYIGTTEGPDAANNPTILGMYATVGHDWVEHDAVAWCAAFVGHCIEQAGLRSTRKLNARSYLDWGVPVELSEAQEGDIVVFSRGDPSGWQGHVAFFVRPVGDASIAVLGGNQGDAVNVKRYATSRLLGIRRAGNVAPSATMSVYGVQTRLRALGYHEVGEADGLLGPRTRAAILAFRDDNALPLIPIIDGTLSDALQNAQPRAVSKERQTGVPVNSRIIAASNAQIGLGLCGAVGSMGSQIAPALSEAENARDVTSRVFVALGLDAWLPAALPWVGAAVFIGLILYAVKARSARIQDHRTGRTL
ncbi:C40 family peptidase [Thalassobacter stenotrophicus]|uniref:Uncharacterized protein n=2 Tax=Thalassobacter stenotrophicus TaxID=266809 RepID=A0A0P1FF20_9RHOB|nr:TIGR02594 family protein [Thalassobacter stenotrophicus]CUH60225.1 hypothetical protein THS5294_01514 [Thalassobacter stenotrophicus]SHI70661.1 TIGR02594 family protein [Thalassobacter stenotrophicus DSM 16310]